MNCTCLKRHYEILVASVIHTLNAVLHDQYLHYKKLADVQNVHQHQNDQVSYHLYQMKQT